MSCKGHAGVIERIFIIPKKDIKNIVSEKGHVVEIKMKRKYGKLDRKVFQHSVNLDLDHQLPDR